MPPPNNSVDGNQEIGYNEGRNDEYAAIAGIDQHSQVVNMDHQKPIHDTECKHEKLIPDEDDTIGDAIYYGCANVKCGFGWYIQNKNPN